VSQYAEVLNSHQRDKATRLHRLYTVIQHIAVSVQAIFLRNGQHRHQPSLPPIPYPPGTSNQPYVKEKKKYEKTPDSTSTRRQEPAVLAIFRENTGAAIQSSPLPQLFYCLKDQYV